MPPKLPVCMINFINLAIEWYTQSQYHHLMTYLHWGRDYPLSSHPEKRINYIVLSSNLQIQIQDQKNCSGKPKNSLPIWCPCPIWETLGVQNGNGRMVSPPPNSFSILNSFSMLKAFRFEYYIHLKMLKLIWNITQGI